MEERGQKIEGSKYIRDFCCRCEEPIRVKCGQLQLGRNLCEDCVGDKVPGIREAARQYRRTINGHQPSGSSEE